MNSNQPTTMFVSDTVDVRFEYGIDASEHGKKMLLNANCFLHKCLQTAQSNNIYRYRQLYIKMSGNARFSLHTLETPTFDKYKDVFFKDGKCKTIVRRLISNIIPFLDYIATDISTKLSTRIGRIKIRGEILI